MDSYGSLEVMTIRTMNDASQRFNLQIDTAYSQFTMKARGVAEPTPIVLHYKLPDTDTLLVEGQFNGEALSVLLRRRGREPLSAGQPRFPRDQRGSVQPIE